MKRFGLLSLKAIALAAMLLNPAISGMAAENGNVSVAGATVSASPVKIKGQVTGTDGLPLIGVGVVVEGTAVGTVTDADGKWELEVSDPDNAVLEFSSLGYETVKEKLSGRTSVNIVMNEDSQMLEETVVIGYGVQKKVNVTGAVTSIDFGKEMEGRPVLSTSAALAGLAPGMSVMQGSGQPGSESAAIRIRGIGSFTSKSSAPLVLVDGISWSMENVNPNDIASISVLKDAASTAIYGTRAANGVILITTKNGSESKPRISYSYKGILQQPYTDLAWVSDYARYMDLYNESCFNDGKANQFSSTNIDMWREAAKNPNALNENGVPNYIAYPNTEWFGELFNNGFSQEHNLSISGGSKKVKYMVSAGYLDNQGVMNRFNLDSSTQKANFRTNLEADVTKWFTVGTKIYGQYQQYGVANIENGFKKLSLTTPGIYPGSENAWGRPANNDESPNANNVFGHMAGRDGSKQMWRVNGSLYTKIRPYKGVSIEGTFNYAPTFGENHTYSRPNGYWDYVNDVRYSTSNLADATVNYKFDRTYNMSTELLARYDGSFGNHNVGILAGYSAIAFREWGWGYQRQGATDWSIHDPNTYETLVSSSSDAITGWGLRSYFARATYSYLDKYMFEANVRVDGSSRFGTNNRYGVFPSFSAGWNIHKEDFMSGTSGWLDNLKLRASWGQTGNNQGIGNFAWQATYATGKVTIDGSNSTGLYIASMSNVNLKWETTATTDIGIEAGFFNSRLTTDIDYYFKNTTDILFTPSTYLTMGNISQVPSNLGAMWNQGIEIALNWKDGIGKDFYYWAGVNFSYNRNMVSSFKGKLNKGMVNGAYVNNIADVSENWGAGKLCEGHMIGEYYMLQRYKGTGAGYSGVGGVDPGAGPVDGMIRTEADLKWVQAMMDSGYSFNGVKTLSPDQLWYGDLIYADSNGDKNYGNEDDKDFNGHSATPSYNLGINLGLSWKGLDFSMLWTGAFDYYIIWNSLIYNAPNTAWGSAISQRIADDHYFYNVDNPEDPRTNINGTYPRLSTNAQRNREVSDFYEYRGDFMKLKNLQIGYTLPENITRKFAVQQLRFYLSGENLLTITEYPGQDPEIGSEVGYPLMRQYSIGAQITF